MNSIKLLLLSACALIFSRPAGFCTANTLTEDVAAINEQLLELKAKNADLQAQLDAAKAVAPTPSDSPIALLCKGAGVDIIDVRWRVQAGLDLEQAVQAAVNQKLHDESALKAKAA